jgi:hypothetical protein
MSEDRDNDKISEEGKGSEPGDGCTSGDDFFGSEGDDDYSTSEEDESGDDAREDDHETDEDDESDGDESDGDESDSDYEGSKACTSVSSGVSESRESTDHYDSEGDSSYSEGKEKGGELWVSDTHQPPPPRKKRSEK